MSDLFECSFCDNSDTCDDLVDALDSGWMAGKEPWSDNDRLMCPNCVDLLDEVKTGDVTVTKTIS